MRRREFITLFGGAAAALTLAKPDKTAAQTKRTARVAILIATDGQRRVDAVRNRLAQLGWIEGQNLLIDYRLPPPDPSQLEKNATELIRLGPDVILGGSTAAVAALVQQTRTIPIVFATVSDPIGSGFVTSLARPGGNVTGFLTYEASLIGKWLELLKELSPRVTRVRTVYHPRTTAGGGSYYPFEKEARLLGLEPVPGPVQTTNDVAPGFAKFSERPHGGIVVLPSPFALEYRELFASTALRHSLPIVNPYRESTISGGLASYGLDLLTEYRAAATYVDRILKGSKPADLPVQTPAKFELAINLKTAKALGLSVPPTLLGRADEVIE